MDKKTSSRGKDQGEKRGRPSKQDQGAKRGRPAKEDK